MSVPGEPADDNPLWRYCVALYGVPGVKDWLLGLQDRLAVDVNFVLLACWCSRCDLALSVADWERLNRATAPLRCNLIAPLRRQRRRLEAGAPAPVRHHLLQAELAAENALYTQLWQWCCSICPASTSPSPSSVEECTATNLAVLASFYGVGRFVGAERLVVAAHQLAVQLAGDSEGRDGLPF